MFKENFVNLCNKHGVAPTAVLVELGYAKSTFSHWDNDTIPRQTTLLKLADYFGVTVDELLRDGPVGGSETAEEEPVPTEKSSDPLALVGELFALIDKMDDKQAEQMSEYLAFLLEKRKRK